MYRHITRAAFYSGPRSVPLIMQRRGRSRSPTGNDERNVFVSPFHAGTKRDCSSNANARNHLSRGTIRQCVLGFCLMQRDTTKLTATLITYANHSSSAVSFPFSARVATRAAFFLSLSLFLRRATSSTMSVANEACADFSNSQPHDNPRRFATSTRGSCVRRPFFPMTMPRSSSLNLVNGKSRPCARIRGRRNWLAITFRKWILARDTAGFIAPRGRARCPRAPHAAPLWSTVHDGRRVIATTVTNLIMQYSGARFYCRADLVPFPRRARQAISTNAPLDRSSSRTFPRYDYGMQFVLE